MKTIKIIFIVLITFVINACSEESVIEGLVPSKLVTVDLNIDITVTTFKPVTLLIDEDEYKIKTSYFRQNPFDSPFQVYFDLLVNNERYIKFRRKNDLAITPIGSSINAAFFNENAYTQEILMSGYIFNPLAGLPDTIYSQNGIKYNVVVYIPFTVDVTTATLKNKNIYGWISAIVTKSKVTLLKMAYVKNTSINAGQEN